MKCHHLAELDGKSSAVTIQDLLLSLQWVHGNIVTQFRSTSITWAWQLAEEYQGNSHFLAVLQLHNAILAQMTLSGLLSNVHF